MSTTTTTAAANRTKSEPNKPLTEAEARRLPKRSKKAKDLHPVKDSDNLWLQHTGEAMSFVLLGHNKKIQKSRIEVGLGSWAKDGASNLSGEGKFSRTWSDAKTRATELMRELRKDIDPKEVERAFRASMRAPKPVPVEAVDDDPRNPPKAKQITVRELVREFSEKSNVAQEWIGKKTATQFLGTMRDYVVPLIGHKLVHTVTADDIFRCLSQKQDETDPQAPILWVRIHRQAKTMRQRLQKMFGYAKNAGHRRENDSSNPAAWEHFEHRLPRSNKIHVVKARPHLSPEEIAEFYRKLVAKGQSQTALALRLKVLTIPRTAMILTARWEDFNFEKKTWTVPGEHLKGDIQRKAIPFVIPLSDAALDLLAEIPGYEKREGFLFPAERKKTGTMHHTAMLAMVYRMGYKGALTPHGMRHTFSTWRGDETEFASEVAEACLAHANGEGNESAKVYNRASYLKRRREVMDAWAAYVTAPAPMPANVVDMKKRTRRAA